MTRQVAAASEPLRLAKTTDAATTEPVEESQYKCSIKPAAAAAPPPPPPRYTEFHQKRRTSKAETTNTTAASTCHRLFHQSRRLRQANLEINNDTRFI